MYKAPLPYNCASFKKIPCLAQQTVDLLPYFQVILFHLQAISEAEYEIISAIMSTVNDV
jgi:hypothetical protein